MSLRDDLRERICTTQQMPNFGLAAFKSWAEGRGLGRAMILTWLNDLQIELNIEAERYRHTPEADPEEAALRGYWCFYCEQLRAYYRAVYKCPECECEFWFLNY